MKQIIIIAITIMLTGFTQAETLYASTNATSVSAPTQYGPVYHVAVDNLSANTIFARPDININRAITTNFYNGSAHVVTGVCFEASNATPIAAGKSFSFLVSKTPIKNIVIQADSGASNLVYIGFNGYSQ